jgi:hypothetical protein
MSLRTNRGEAQRKSAKDVEGFPSGAEKIERRIKPEGKG